MVATAPAAAPCSRRFSESPCSIDGTSMTFTSKMRKGRAPRGDVLDGGAHSTRIGTQLYWEFCRACRRHQGCHCSKRRLRYVADFWAALGQATACLYLLNWGVGREAQWGGWKLMPPQEAEKPRLLGILLHASARARDFDTFLCTVSANSLDSVPVKAQPKNNLSGGSPCRRLKKEIRKVRNRRRTKTSPRPLCRPTRWRKARANRSAARSRKRPDAKLGLKQILSQVPPCGQSDGAAHR